MLLQFDRLHPKHRPRQVPGLLGLGLWPSRIVEEAVHFEEERALSDSDRWEEGATTPAAGDLSARASILSRISSTIHEADGTLRDRSPLASPEIK